MVAFHPRAGIGDQRETCRVALRKTVAAETFDLLEDTVGELRRIAARHHAADQLGVELVDATCHLERRHRAAELVGLAAGKPGAHHRHLHRLLLEQRHAECFPQHGAQFFCRQVGFFQTVAPAQVGMHHVALYRTWANDGHLYRQVVQLAWFQARQHGHLRAALDLEHADRVRTLYHPVGFRIFGRHVRHGGKCDAAVFRQQIECAAHAAEHSQAKHIDLHEFQVVDIVLVPLDNLAIVHRRGLDRHQRIQPVLRQHETAGMLREMARKADQLAGDIQRHRQAPVGYVQVQRLGVLHVHAVAAPTPYLA